jgi:hypothetical protein
MLPVVPENIYARARRSERKRVKIAIVLVVDGEEAEHRACTVDVSEYGLRLQPGVGLTPGQSAHVIFESSPEVALESRVVWVGPMGSDGETEAGLEFLNPPSSPPA